VIRAPAAVALALGVTLRPGVARADGMAPPAGEMAPPDPPPAPTPRRPDLTIRLALLGDYRSLLDLSALGGGAALSIGRADDRYAMQLELRALTGRTWGGLSTLEVGAGASGEVQIVGGAFVGAGAGLAVFGVRRATDGSELLSVGPEVYARAGYRFGSHAAPFLALDLGGQLQGGGRDGTTIATPVWGPTLAVGYTF
jgi:hypothetical protein